MYKISRSLLVLSVLCGFAVQAEAQQQSAVITESTCEVVAKSGSAAGAIGGAAVGEIAGSIVGEALFGSSGRGLGSLLGGGAGSAIGENAFANNTYRCVLTVRTSDGKNVYLESLGKLRNIGQAVTIVQKGDGDYIIVR
jgi:outer membrane lipoprotein SlyB